MRNNGIKIIIAAAIAITAVSCQKNGFDTVYTGGDGIVKFNPSVAQTGVSTKAQSSGIYESILADAEGIIDIPVAFKANEGIGAYANPEASTKGDLINTTGSTQNFPTDKTFKVSAWTGTTQDFAYNDVVYRTSDGGYWITVNAGKDKEYLWKNGQTKTFFAYANLPASGASVTNTSSEGQTLTYTVPVSPASQTDILMAMYSGTATSKSGALVPLTFHHPLTAVNVRLGEIKGVTSFEINSISIEKVYASGSVTQSSTNPAASTWNSTSGTVTVTQDITSMPTPTTSDPTPVVGDTFLLIPQKFDATSTARLKINCTVDGKTGNIFLPLNTKIGEGASAHFADWKAQYTNSFVIGYDGSFDFEVLEVAGDVTTDYQAVGDKKYTVISDSPWKMQYKDGSGEWQDVSATASENPFNDWLSFDVVAGEKYRTVVNATVASAAGDPQEITIKHTEELRSRSPKGTATAPYDLSMHDIYGNEREEGKPVTANSYVVTSAGWYAFPLVYGNAIDFSKPGLTDGVNTVAFNTTASSGTNVLKPFKDADGNGITSPYITGASTAIPLWEDVGSYAIVSNSSDDCKVLDISDAAAAGLTLAKAGKCGYVLFHVNQTTLAQGNVLIAVKNSSSNIIWSWHIWVTDNDLTPKAVYPSGVTTESASLKMMPMNLGWVDASDESVQKGYARKSLDIRFVQVDGDEIKNEVGKTALRKEYVTHMESTTGIAPSYQWGRKDPFIRGNGADNEELAADHKSGESTIILQVNNNSATIAYSIKNPTHFCFFTSGQQWYKEGSSLFNNLWSATNTTYGTGAYGYDEKPVKTIYDPCPPEFQAPQGNAYTGFSVSSTEGAFNRGYNFKTGDPSGTQIFLSASGYRANNTKNLATVGEVGVYWTAVPSSMTLENLNAYSMSFRSTSISLNLENGPACGFSIRPVAE